MSAGLKLSVVRDLPGKLPSNCEKAAILVDAEVIIYRAVAVLDRDS